MCNGCPVVGKVQEILYSYTSTCANSLTCANSIHALFFWPLHVRRPTCFTGRGMRLFQWAESSFAAARDKISDHCKTVSLDYNNI